MRTISAMLCVAWLAGCGGPATPRVKTVAPVAGEPLGPPLAAVQLIGPKPLAPALPGDDSYVGVLAELESAAPPFLAARVYGLGATGEQPERCVLAVRTERGWFTYLERFVCNEELQDGGTDLVVPELTVRDALPGGEPELLVRLSTRTWVENRDNDGWSREQGTEQQLICGIGSSSAPSCAAIAVRRWWQRELFEPERGPSAASAEDGPAAGEVVLTVEYEAGVVVIRGPEQVVPDAPDPRGRRPLSFL